MVNITENFKKVQDRINTSALKLGRDPKQIKLIAVTKTIDADIIKEAISSGIIAIGENKVQDAKDKFIAIGNTIEWHMIGALQTNKVKDAVRIFDMIHSLDRINLAQEIDKEGKKADKVIKTLIEVNITEDPAKHGILIKDIWGLLQAVANMTHINVEGLMTIAPYGEDTKKIRKCFYILRRLAEDIEQDMLNNINMKYLSMGMSNDFEIAIEEGANILRIGTAIFGERL
ncbi:MAG: YggS family pyridoxal phosphate-dependent enzyme [Candidatus Firestonebacteria bacterium]